MAHIVVLSGAGISADSGLATFRDSGGLWEGYDINEVASIEGWYKDREKVLEFYNLRRKQAAEATPNPGHISIAELEKKYEVSVITQNVDDLHERAGSTNVLHLHGMLKNARSEIDPDIKMEIGAKPIKPGDVAEDGAQLRPDIVWFGEPVPMIEPAIEIAMKADIFIVVGTSLAVYPAAGLIDYVKAGSLRFIVDPSNPELYSDYKWEHFREKAAGGLPKLTKRLLNNVDFYE